MRCLPAALVVPAENEAIPKLKGGRAKVSGAELLPAVCTLSSSMRLGQAGGVARDNCDRGPPESLKPMRGRHQPHWEGQCSHTLGRFPLLEMLHFLFPATTPTCGQLQQNA